MPRLAQVIKKDQRDGVSNDCRGERPCLAEMGPPNQLVAKDFLLRLKHCFEHLIL
jgi:hypothetical protein